MADVFCRATCSDRERICFARLLGFLSDSVLSEPPWSCTQFHATLNPKFLKTMLINQETAPQCVLAKSAKIGKMSNNTSGANCWT